MAVDVLVADDHPIVRQGLKAFLSGAGFRVVAECADGGEALRQAAKLRPSVAILDLSMPQLNGIDAAVEIRQASPRTTIILLTVHREDQYLLEALRAGVHGYVLKMEAGTALVEAIHEARRGNMYVSPGMCRALVDGYRSESAPADYPLTAREQEILRLIAEGHTTREVAQRLSLSVKTAESYRTALMNKLDIHETANLVRYAVRCGLVSA